MKKMQTRKILIKVCAWIALAAFAGLTILSAAMSSVYAAKSSSQIKKEMDAAKKEKSAAASQHEALDAEITKVSEKIHSLEVDIDANQVKIDQTAKELEEAEAKSAEQNESYITRVKYMIENGDQTYLEMLSTSNSLTDFLNRMEIVKMVSEYDKNLLDTLKATEEKIRTLKDDLDKTQATLNANKSNLESNKATLNAKIAQNEERQKKLESDIAAYQKAYEAAQKQEAAAWASAQAKVSTNTKFVGGQFGWPSASSTIITSQYGRRLHPVLGTYRGHAGIDIGAGYGTNVLAANDGTVIVAGYNSGGYGNYVIIDHGGGYTTLYGHNSSLCVSAGQKVTRGTVIAKCGSTGLSSGPHIHFEVRVNGSPVNPLPYVQK